MRKGPLDEVIADTIGDVRRRGQAWRGTIPVRLVSVEQVRTMGAGMQALVTLDTLDREDSYSFVISPEDAREAARRLAPIGEAGSGLFVAR